MAVAIKNELQKRRQVKLEDRQLYQLELTRKRDVMFSDESEISRWTRGRDVRKAILTKD